MAARVAMVLRNYSLPLKFLDDGTTGSDFIFAVIVASLENVRVIK